MALKLSDSVGFGSQGLPNPLQMSSTRTGRGSTCATHALRLRFGSSKAGSIGSKKKEEQGGFSVEGSHTLGLQIRKKD